ncbi:MAG TPA: hypothetical protein PLP33_16480 [Leptospiraceae bacterium]|nr:hypothetical protein [Leptospiraceae bacterium]
MYGNRRTSRSFIEIMVMTAIGLIFLIIFAAIIGRGCISSNSSATEAANRYVSTFHPDWSSPRVSCQSYDTDQNGYVSCTIGAQGRQPESIECPGIVSFNSECRITRAQIQVPSNGN